MQRRSHLNRPRNPGWVRVDCYLGNQRKAYDAELIALRAGLQSLVERPDRRAEYAASTNPQVAMLRVRNDAPGLGEALATPIIRPAGILRDRGVQ